MTQQQTLARTYHVEFSRWLMDIKIAHFKDIVVFTNFDRQGIGNQQERIPWEEVQEITLKNGSAIVQKREK